MSVKGWQLWMPWHAHTNVREVMLVTIFCLSFAHSLFQGSSSCGAARNLLWGIPSESVPSKQKSVLWTQPPSQLVLSEFIAASACPLAVFFLKSNVLNNFTPRMKGMAVRSHLYWPNHPQPALYESWFLQGHVSLCNSERTMLEEEEEIIFLGSFKLQHLIGFLLTYNGRYNYYSLQHLGIGCI